MKRTIVFFLLFFVSGTLLAGFRPKAVTQMIQLFVSNYYLHDRFAWARLHAWGTGEVAGKKFVWVGWTNTDGLVTLDISLLLPKEVEKKIVNLKDRYNRSYEVYTLRTKSSISTSNDWLDWGGTQFKPINPVKSYIALLNEKTGLNLKIREFLK